MTTLAFPPAGACDCHVHVIGPKSRFPLARERAYTPKDALLKELQAMLARLQLDRVVLVQPSIYGTDNACMMDAIDSIGETARGVAVLAPGTAGSFIDDLHRRGVRGLRVNVATSGPTDPDQVREPLLETAALCARNGWHLQTFLPTAAIEPLAEILLELPVPVVIDHFGLIRAGAQSSSPADTLVRLLQSGRVWVKLSASYRIAEDPCDPAIIPLARRLAAANPERVVWGSDWPHTPAHHRGHAVSDEEEPYRNLDTGALLTFTRNWFEDAATLHRLLVDNPAALYDFPG
jgi:predicted TIM-barrel fold metal-dependent hydrolase